MPTFFFGLLLGVLIPRAKGGDGPQRPPASPAPWRGAFRTICCFWTERRKTGKHVWLPAPARPASAVYSGPCVLLPSGPNSWTLFAPGTRALGWHPLSAWDGWWSEPRLCRARDLEASRCRRGRQECPRCTFLLGQKHLEGYGHRSTKMLERG